MHNTLRLLQPIPLLQLTALLQAIPVQLVDILQPLMAGRAIATAQDIPTSCAKLSERVRLVTVAPTLSPMPNGKPLSSASGTAESASSAIAFRRTDYWLKPRRNASARLSLRACKSGAGELTSQRSARGPHFLIDGVSSQPKRPQARGFFAHRLQFGLVLGHCLLGLVRLLFFLEQRFGTAVCLVSIHAQYGTPGKSP